MCVCVWLERVEVVRGSGKLVMEPFAEFASCWGVCGTVGVRMFVFVVDELGAVALKTTEVFGPT